MVPDASRVIAQAATRRPDSHHDSGQDCDAINKAQEHGAELRMSNLLDYLAAAPALMPMPGEAVTRDDKVAKLEQADSPSPSTPSPSPRPADARHALRRRSLELVAEAQGDVDSFVKELDQKRRQLDDHIHKFIAQKEREFKLFERELRTRYRTPSSPSTPPLQKPASASASESASASLPPAAEKPPQPVTVPGDASPANEKSHEREADLLGLFTPAYLPLLESRPPGPGRSPSAPSATDTGTSSAIGPDRQALQRANTDPVGDSPSATLSRLGLGPRTPSSGSDPGRSLVSALKSPSAGPRLPKQKRVSLIVGDEVVAPSDNIFSNLDKNSDKHPDSAPNEQAIEPKQPTGPAQDEARDQVPAQSSPLKQPEPRVQQNTQKNAQPGGLSLGFASVTRESTNSKEPLRTSVEPVGDIELSSPFSMDEEFGDSGTSDMYTTQIEDIDADVDSGLDSESTLRAASPASPETKDTSPPTNPPNLGVPIARFRSSSSSSSAQPISPGFSRPSVREDPQFNFASQSPVETPAQGSLYDSFSRPSYSKQQQTSGSLGESFMQRNAEEMMRRRQSTQRS